MGFFWELHSTRQSSGMGLCRLTRAEIHLWETDERRVLQLWERKTLLAIDAAWFAAANSTGGPADNDVKEEV